MITKQFLVTITLKENVANERIQGFIKSGIKTECNMRPPGEELSDCNFKLRSVKSLPPKENTHAKYKGK